MTLRCRRCNRPIKAQTLIERGILVSYGTTCARIVFSMPKRKPKMFSVLRIAAIRHRLRAAEPDDKGQMLLELGYA